MLFYVAACVGTGLSNSFPVLMVFRFLQAAGSSSTIPIRAGVIANITPPSERGGFIGTFSGGPSLFVLLELYPVKAF